MGIYVVTGGAKGIGFETVRILRDHGHEVLNVDRERGDINADLGTKEGRAKALAQLHGSFPDGLDGLVCNHGITGLPRHKASYVVSVNYFGAVEIMEGLFDLLKKKEGNCVATVSGAIAHVERGKYFFDQLLTNCGDEERIGRLVDTFPLHDVFKDHSQVYLCTKYALANWVRRLAPSWAVQGVNLNAVAPGGSATTIMEDFKAPNAEKYYFPMPVTFPKKRPLLPYEVAQALAFLVLPGAAGCSGAVLFCDGGHKAIVDPDKPY